jgi:hypothetical protein
MTITVNNREIRVLNYDKNTYIDDDGILYDKLSLKMVGKHP